VRIDLLGVRILRGRGEDVREHGKRQLHGPDVVPGGRGLRRLKLSDRLHRLTKLPERRLLFGWNLRASARHAHVRAVASHSGPMLSASRHALIIGNSDGIGLHSTRRLLDRGWQVTGISRRASPVAHTGYQHHVLDVSQRDYVERLVAILGPRSVDTCIYCAGIGGSSDPKDVGSDVHVFEVNLMGALHTAAVLVPVMVAAGRGHLVVLSSQADGLVLARAPSYAASKAALSSYFESLGLALRPHGVAVSNLRLGFVDTKMARATLRPFMYTLDQAVDAVECVLRKRPLRLTRPLAMALLVRLVAWLGRWRVFLTRGPTSPRT